MILAPGIAAQHPSRQADRDDIGFERAWRLIEHKSLFTFTQHHLLYRMAHSINVRVRNERLTGMENFKGATAEGTEAVPEYNIGNLSFRFHWDDFFILARGEFRRRGAKRRRI